MYIEIYAHMWKLNYDSQEGNNLTAHGQDIPCLVKTLQQDSIPLHTVKPMQRIAVTFVAFGLDSLPLLLWWDIF